MLDNRQRQLWFLCSTSMEQDSHATLVVIDMQSGFDANSEVGLIAAILQLLRRAMQCGDAIILVSSTKHGTINGEITAVVADYERCKSVTKTRNSGAREILSACFEYGFSFTKFRLCGNRTNVCVQETVEELLALSPFCRIELQREALSNAPECNNFEEFNQDERLSIVSMA